MGLGNLLGDAYSVAKKVGSDIRPDGLIADTVKSLYQPVGLAVDIGTSVVADNYHVGQLISDIGKATKSRVGDSLAPVGDVLTGDVMPVGGAALGAFNSVRNQAFTRPESTLFLYGNKNIGFNPLDAWRAAHNISPGQAFVTSAFGDLPGVHGHGFLNENFDVSDPEQRKAFNHGFGKFASGSVDGYLSFAVGPDILAGKALAGKRVMVNEGATGLKKFGIADTSPFKVAQAPAEPLKLAGGREVTRGRNLKAVTPTDLDQVMTRSNVVQVVDHLASLPPAQRALATARMKSFKGAVGLQHVINNATDADEIRMAIRYAIDPTEVNRVQLAAISKTAGDKVNYLRDVRIPALQRSLDVVKAGGPMAMNISTDGLTSDLRIANQQLEESSRGLTLAKAQESSAGSLLAAPRLTTAEHALAGSAWDVYQPTRYGVATRMLRSAGTGRISMVDLNRQGSATQAAKAMLDRVGHGWRTSDQAGVGSRINPATKARLLAAVQAAEIQGPQAVMKAMQDVESEAFSWYGKQLNLTEEQTRGIAEAASERRNRAQGQFFGGGDSTAYSGAKDDTGRWLDVIDDPSQGTKFRSPITTSQFIDKMPLVDVDEIARAVRLHGDLMSDKEWKVLLASWSGGSIDHADLTGAGLEMLDKFNRVWKPLQLLRLGWPIRVITDENMRIMATLGAMSHLPLAAKSFARGVSQSRPVYRGRDLLSTMDRAAAKHNLDNVFRPAIAADAQKKDLVKQIQSASELVAAHDTEITKTMDGLQGLLRDDAPFLYRAAPARATHATGGRGVTFRLNPEVPAGEDVMHSRRMATDDSKVMRPRSTDDAEHPGTAALRDLVRPEEFTRLQNMTNKDLAALIRKEGGFAVQGNKGSMLSAYGAVVARRQGYSAIAHGEQYTALADDALRAGDAAGHHAGIDAASAKLDDLMSARAGISDMKRQLEQKEQGIPAWNPAWNDDLSQALADYVKPSAVRKVEGPKSKFSGEIEITLPSGQIINVPDAFNGRHGKIYLDLSSSNSAARALAGAQDRHMNMLRRRMGEVSTIAPVHDPEELNPDKIKLHYEAYDKGWETAANDQLGQNPTARQIMSGKDDAEMMDWVRNTPEGREERRLIGYRGHALEQWISEVRQQVDHYLPTPELKQLALEQRATAADLKATFPTATDRPMVHGESVDMALGKGEGHQITNGIVNTMFKYLGTLPTDALSRHPYFANVYRRSMERQAAGLGLKDDELLTPEMADRMSHRAREEALGRTKAVLYDTANESHLGHTLRFVAPFYNAWQEALTVWGKIFLDDPATLARSIQVWNAPSKAHEVYTNPYGQKEIVAPLPDWVTNKIGAGKLGIPANYLPSLIASGSYPYLPGFGAPVTVPVSAFVRDHPDKIDMVKPLIPYGAGNSVTDQIFPSGLKHLLSWQKGVDDDTYASDYTRNAIDMEVARREGKLPADMTDQQLLAEAKRRTDHFGAIRVLSSLTLPFSPDFKSPYQMYIDSARTMRTTYQTYPGGKDPQGNTWDQAFLTKFGEDYFAFTQSATKSNVGGIAPTEEGYRATQKYADQIQAHPQWGGLIVGNEDDGTLSSEVMHWQERTSIGGGDTSKMRDVRDPKQAIIDAQTSQGWDDFRKVNTAITNALAKRGLHSITQTGAQDLALVKKYMVAQIKQKYPAWGDPANENGYDTFTKGSADALITYLQTGGPKGTSLVNDPRFAGRAGWTTVASYLALRNQVEGALKSRKAAGGSMNLQARANLDLRGVWELSVGQMQQRDTAFADIYTRWLSNDTLENAT